VTVWRKRKETPVNVKVGELQEDDKTADASASQKPSSQSGPAATVKALGLSLAGVTPELKQKFSLADDADGVVVVDVAGDTPAAEKGVRPGDIIAEVAQQEVKTPEQVTARIEEARKAGRKSILLLIDRAGDLRFIALRIDQG
jgi:serine protease Do